MIDIHSHILPGVDDGAKTLEDALEMLSLASASGVTTQVLTPHVQPGRFDNAKADLERRFDAFRSEADRAGIEIDLRLAAEVHVGPEIMQLVADDTLPWLGEYRGMRTFLLEFPLSHTPAGSINLVHWLIQRDVLPVIVHPERCREWQDHPDRLRPFLEAGCPIQITASSLLGGVGGAAKRLALELAQSQPELIIATDCHNLAYRPPDLDQGHEVLRDLRDADFAAHSTLAFPAALTGN